MYVLKQQRIFIKYNLFTLKKSFFSPSYLSLSQLAHMSATFGKPFNEINESIIKDKMRQIICWRLQHPLIQSSHVIPIIIFYVDNNVDLDKK